MLKKMLLAGAVLLAGSMIAPKSAEASHGMRYRAPGWAAPPVRSFRPYYGPRYGAGFRYGAPPVMRYGAPGYWGPRYGVPMRRGPSVGIGIGVGRPMWGRPGGVFIGPGFRGW